MYTVKIENKHYDLSKFKNNHPGGEKFIAAARKKNTIGLQFHPERSGLMGLELLKSILSKANN